MAFDATVNIPTGQSYKRILSTVIHSSWHLGMMLNDSVTSFLFVMSLSNF